MPNAGKGSETGMEHIQWIVREAVEGDMSAILDLYAECGLDDGIRLDDATAGAIFRRFAAYPNYRLFVVTGPDGAVLATYALLIMDNIAHAGAPLSVVEQVAVASRHQGAGLGTLMMHHAMEESRRLGCYKLALSSAVKRERAHDFYDKLGFERHGYSFVVDLVDQGTPQSAADS